MLIRYKKLNGSATAPNYGHSGDAGLDLYSVENHFIAGGETAMVGTGIAIEIPPGYFGAVYARSGLATKQGLRPANCTGVIDAPYRGEIVVALHNDSWEGREIHKGDRIAQLVIQPCMQVVLQEVEELTETPRGAGGFGSTGIGKTTEATGIFDYEQLTLQDVINQRG